MPAPFHQLHHICIVVHDVDAAVAYYESLGMGPWTPFPPLTDFAELEMPNTDAFVQMRYRFLNLVNVQIQLCEPPDQPCPQREFLDEHGEGVFQLGFESELTSGEAAARAVGLDVLMRGRRSNGTGFCYFDTLAETGLSWMIRQSTPDGDMD